MEIIEKAKHDTAAGSNPKKQFIEDNLDGSETSISYFEDCGFDLKNNSTVTEVMPLSADSVKLQCIFNK